ncbi:hypothetical protein HK097_003857 [Rhizophlyctis rosea]|uniref:Uncharacterized protein n=1 Tax=Rhizophlyctis rosea TaxID=64517 RepID=A0AAD5WXQ1_9FUNG|nr:hypothetical protein HK097_003857 [Rhizophlyctis rosea]
MIETWSSHRPYISSPPSSLLPLHEQQVKELKQTLSEGDKVTSVGVVTGPAGSGKSTVVRRVVGGRDYVAVLSVGLVSGVKSLVDGLAEEVGYDFDDVSSMRLPKETPGIGYVDRFTHICVQIIDGTQAIDKLAFLLDEMEEASWQLKYSQPATTTPIRPIFVFDDIDALDLTDPQIQKAVRMLFNAAHKWAREDTAQVIFTYSDTAAKNVEKIVRDDVMKFARVLRVGGLTNEDAETYIQTTAQIPTSPPCRRYAIETVGTNLSDLQLLTHKSNALSVSIRDVAKSQFIATVLTISDGLKDISSSVDVDRKVLKSFLKTLDKKSDGKSKKDAGKSVEEVVKSCGKTEVVDRKLVGLFAEKGVLKEDGEFVGEGVRRGWRVFRGLEDWKKWSA